MTFVIKCTRGDLKPVKPWTFYTNYHFMLCKITYFKETRMMDLLL